MTPPTIHLSQEQVDAFHRDGFVAVESLTTPAEVAILREVYDRLFARNDFAGDRLELAALDDEGRETLPQIMNPEKYAPELDDTLARANALAIARRLLGPDAERGGDHAIMKPPGHGAPTPWHQDEAYWHPGFDHTGISVWMPLQPAVPESGCMQFVPGSHRKAVVPHHLIDPDAHALEADDPVAEEAAVAVPLPAGGCTIHHCRTLHYAGANLSTEPRRAYIMGFSVPARPLDEPRDYYWQRPEWYDA
jgi:ectoine hydroxylase-related dioxygenase (phytanoyl-CoA dioxygenase family)